MLGSFYTTIMNNKNRPEPIGALFFAFDVDSEIFYLLGKQRAEAKQCSIINDLIKISSRAIDPFIMLPGAKRELPWHMIIGRTNSNNKRIFSRGSSPLWCSGHLERVSEARPVLTICTCSFLSLCSCLSHSDVSICRHEFARWVERDCVDSTGRDL